MSRFLDDLLNIDNKYFNGINQFCPSELQLNDANPSETEAPFLDLHLSIFDGFISCKIYKKRDDFDFEIVNCPNTDGYVPHRASYGVSITQLIRFVRVSSHVTNFTRNELLTAKLRKAFSKLYRRYFDFVWKFNVGLKCLLQQGLSEPDFYGDLEYKFRKIYACNSTQFRKIILRYSRLSLFRIPRDSLKYFEISVVRHIRFAELRKK